MRVTRCHVSCVQSVMQHGMSYPNVQDEIGSDLQRARCLGLSLFAALGGSGKANLGRTIGPEAIAGLWMN